MYTWQTVRWPVGRPTAYTKKDLLAPVDQAVNRLIVQKRKIKGRSIDRSTGPNRELGSLSRSTARVSDRLIICTNMYIPLAKSSIYRAVNHFGLTKASIDHTVDQLGLKSFFWNIFEFQIFFKIFCIGLLVMQQCVGNEIHVLNLL